MDKRPVQVAAFIFLVVGLAHLSRLVFHFNLVIGSWAVPFWVNGIAAVVAFSLSCWLFKTSKN